MRGPVLYVKKAYVGGEECELYALEGSLSSDGGSRLTRTQFMLFTSLTGAPEWLNQREPKVKVLPDEQSLLTMFPLDILLGRARHASRALDDLARRLREARTNVLCFEPGCRKRARYKAVASVGLEGGCWLACSGDHFSRKTTKGFDLREEDFVDFRNVA
jgi:hypothetical protein